MREPFACRDGFSRRVTVASVSKNMIESQKSVYHHIVFDSDVEENFARSFELSDDVQVHAKLPSWFKIDTPLGSYNPDWAVLVEADGQQRLYFVVESKGGLLPDALRPAEQARIDCGRKHFQALNSDVRFKVANDFPAFSAEFVQ